MDATLTLQEIISKVSTKTQNMAQLIPILIVFLKSNLLQALVSMIWEILIKWLKAILIRPIEVEDQGFLIAKPVLRTLFGKLEKILDREDMSLNFPPLLVDFLII